MQGRTGMSLMVLAPRAELPAIFGGGPLVLVDALLPDQAALAVPGLVACRVEPGAAQAVLRLSAASAEEELVPVPHPPAGLLAVIGREAPPLRPLLAWCEAAGGEAPPLILAEGALAALPALLEILLADGARYAARAATLELLLAELRGEAEAIRSAAAAMAAIRPEAPAAAPGARVLDLPDPSLPALRLGSAPLVLSPGIPTGGVAAIAIHLPGPAGAGLSAEVSAAESGRVLGTWQVPAAAMPGGWFRLDLPEPEPRGGESLAVVLAADPPGEELLLSASAPGRPALAIGTAPHGYRPMPAAFFVRPAAEGPPLPGVLRLSPRAGVPTPPIVPPPVLADAPLPSVLAPPADKAAWRAVVLDGQQRGDGWELIGLSVARLVFERETWREVKVKFGTAGDALTLEFRQGAEWPVMFQHWPGDETDAHGEKFVVVVDVDRIWGLDRLAPGRDRLLVTALADAMPALVDTVLEGGDAGRFRAAAARFRTLIWLEDL
jgi:hypothetical protein